MENKAYIFGAHSRAQTLAVYLSYLYKDIHIEAYIYDNDEENPENIGEIPVFRINENIEINMRKLSLNFPVYIGTRGIFHEKIIEVLKRIGFKVIFPLTVEMDLMLRNQYLEKYYAHVGRKFIKLNRLTTLSALRGENSALANKVSASVYTVKSPFDRSLQQEYLLASYEKEIYAGAVFVDNSQRILFQNTLKDDVGDNISNKNKQFCELTALYWIWKHGREDILGLAHYRRHFLLPENWKERMIDNGVDVILPVPLYVAPSVEENYKNRHDPSDWEFMMQYLKDKFPGDYREACRFFKGNLYFPCNMFVMKRKVLDDLCAWLFPVLFKVAEHGGIKDNPYFNRYPGFISERLISLFFEINRDRFKVVYADKNFLP